MKFIESGGAIPIPLEWTLDHKSMNSILDKLNGVLFTGGNMVFYE